MIEYIEREVIKKMLENAQIISDGEYSGYCTEDINVDDIPAEDVEPVKRGRWIKDKSGVIYCSECEEEHEWIDFRALYCDNCGAKMQEAR